MHADRPDPAASTDDLEDHDRGLRFDLATMGRRRLLTLLGGAGLVTLVGACTSDNTSSDSTAASTGPSATTGAAGTAATTAASGSTSTTTGTTAASGSTSTTTSTAEASCAPAPIPEETAGPFPADGTNGVDVLTEDGIVRSDLRSSFGSSSGVAAGVPLTIDLTVIDTADGCAPLASGAVYLWQCDRDGLYSLYSRDVTDQNYLRGVQPTGADGTLSFTSIFPACYSGRWPHIHFEVYRSVDDATGTGEPIATSQIALPEDICNEVFATAGYEQSVRNMSQVSLSTDNVFRDGVSQQTPTVSGDAAGVTIALTVAV